MSATGTVIALSKVAPLIGEYLGLIEGVSSNVKKLLHKDFLSAKSNMECSLTSLNDKDEDTAKSYLLDARREFNSATCLEENENLISAYTGLALCQYLLGDFNNAKLTIKKIREVSLSLSESAICTAAGLVFPRGRVFGIPIYNPIQNAIDILKHGGSGPILQLRNVCLEEYKKKSFEFFQHTIKCYAQGID